MARSTGLAFRRRGHRNVSRIESFSDAVFGFSLTLLVVSLQVPQTFEDLAVALAGFPGFALSFALLAQIWYLQNRFFRRYALDDTKTIFLNLVLLFCVVFFTYPLKFLFRLVTGPGRLEVSQILPLFAIYGAGYAAVFAIFFLLHRHALALRRELGLSPYEVFETRFASARDAMQVGVPILSVALVALCVATEHYALAGLAGGLAYGIAIPVGLTIAFRVARRKREQLFGTGEVGADALAHDAAAAPREH